MNIDKAIEHAFEVSTTCENASCALEHVQLAFWLKQLKELQSILGYSYELDRLKELAEADKEGRCLVLPCKVGDTVYRVLYSCHNADHSEIKRCDECGEECDIEKTITSFIVPDLDWIIINYYAFQNGTWKTTKEEADAERWGD